MGWDGKPEASEPASAPQTEEVPQTAVPSSEIDPFPPIESLDAPIEPPSDSPMDFLDPLPEFTPPPREETSSQSDTGVDEMPTDNMSTDFMSSPPQDHASAILEIERFSNQNQEATALSYNLIIRGIDLPKQIQIVREAIQDSRFGWDPDQILAKISQGQLIITGLNPIKTSLLVQRMKFSELEIDWVQNVLT